MQKTGLRQTAENIWNFVTRIENKNKLIKIVWLNLHLVSVCP